MEGVEAAQTALACGGTGHDAPPAGSLCASTYDQVPYSVGAFPQTSPDHLATLAALFGMCPADARRCRVLELGCAAGGNLIPMALAAPESRFVGIDLSGRQIADGQSRVRELGLMNVELRRADIASVGDELGRFDYILAHGVYSWVPPAVQSSILRICKRNLASQGVAYVSYNCYPGWHARGALREMMGYHTGRFTDPLQRVRAARGLLVFLAKSLGGREGGGYDALIRRELALLLKTPDSYLLHEHLDEYNEPLYFHQFARRAADEGLQYLAEAQVTTMIAGRFGSGIEEALRQIAPDLLHLEQYMDFLDNRMFRQTLLCHDDVALRAGMDPEAVETFYAASRALAVSASVDLAPHAAEEFKAETGDARLVTQDPLIKAALVRLAEEWPLPIAFDPLLAAARARLGEAAPAAGDGARRWLAAALLRGYTLGLIEFHSSPPPFTLTVGKRPIASAYARLCARDGAKVTNMKLQSLQLSQGARLVLRHLDGSQDVGALAGLVDAWMKTQSASSSGAAPTGVVGAGAPTTEVVRRLLHGFARAALLVG